MALVCLHPDRASCFSGFLCQNSIIWLNLHVPRRLFKQSDGGAPLNEGLYHF